MVGVRPGQLLRCWGHTAAAAWGWQYSGDCRCSNLTLQACLPTLITHAKPPIPAAAHRERAVLERGGRGAGCGGGVCARIRLQLLRQAQSPPLLAAQVDQHARPRRHNGAQRGVQLGAAVAALSTQQVAQHGLGVHARQHARAARHVAVHQRQVLRAVQQRAVGARLKGAVPAAGGMGGGGGREGVGNRWVGLCG